MSRPMDFRLSGASSDGNILVINCGSSSVKFALFGPDAPLSRLWSGAIERIGLRNGRFHAVDADGATALEGSREIPDHDAALALLMDATERHPSGAPQFLVTSRARSIWADVRDGLLVGV